MGAGVLLGAGAAVAGFVVALRMDEALAVWIYSAVTATMIVTAIGVVCGMLDTQKSARAEVENWPRKWASEAISRAWACPPGSRT